MTLPPLPEPAREVVYIYNASKGYSFSVYNSDQMRAYGEACAAAAVAAEREACAKVCEDKIAVFPQPTRDAFDAGRLAALRSAADAIRTRSGA